MIRPILSALCLTAAVVSAAPALAQEDVSVHVSYADLNLARPAGVETFHSRLNNAVTTICGTTDPRDLRRASIIKACRDTASLSAERQVRQAIASAQTPMLASAESKLSNR